MQLKLKRSAIIQLFLNGAKQSEIIQSLGTEELSRSFVSRTIKQFKDTGEIIDRRISGRPGMIRTLLNKKILGK